MPTEKCPHCEEMVELRFGRGIPCPRCGERLDIFDDGHSLDSSSEIRSESGTRRSTVADALSKTYSPPKKSTSSDQSFIPGGVTYRNIGGLDKVITQLDLIINGAWRYPRVWKHLGGKQVRGVLLYGPPGCGKTLLAQAIAGAGKRKCAVVQGSETNAWRVGESERNLKEKYLEVAPDGILILEEIDAIGSGRAGMINETSRAVVATLLSLLDGAKYKNRVVIIATTNVPHLLDPALRRPGRFDLEVYIPPPNEEGRKHIFAIHTRGMPLASDVDFSELAAKAHGFTGADIAGVCTSVSNRLLATAAKKLEQEGIAQEAVIRDLWATRDAFCSLIESTIPSVLREGFVPVSKTGWGNIGGLTDVKERIQRVILWPSQYGDEMKALRMGQPKGMLLYGPPGCGKTLLAKAIAGQSGCNLLVVNGPAFANQLLGDIEAGIRKVFWQARQAAPCVIFLDEVDSIAPARGRVTSNDAIERGVSQLLVEIDGVQTLSGVFVLAATNRPELVDPALLRPGRLDLPFEIKPPDRDGRREIFAIYLHEVALADVDVEDLLCQTEGYSGADIELVCTTAKEYVLERYIASGKASTLAITHEDMIRGCADVKRRVY